AMRVGLFGLPVMKLRTDPYYDPLAFINYGVLKDGTRVTAQDLRDGLFPARPGHSRPRRPEQKPSLYDTAYEAKIDYLVMKEASVTSKEKSADDQEIGSWDYNVLGHPKLREVRGMAVL